MRKLAIIELLSLDGVAQSPTPEDTGDGFPYPGWAQQYQDEVLAARAVRGLAETDAYLFGRKTYELMAAHWPTAPVDDPIAASLNGARKYVASRTLRSLAWQNSTLIEGGVPTAVAALKRGDGGTIAVMGSGTLVRTLMDNDLVDEYVLMVHPILLGRGRRLFGEAPASRRLRLVEAVPTGVGSLILTYAPADRAAATAQPVTAQPVAAQPVAAQPATATSAR